MRHVLVFATLLTLSIALGSTLMVITTLSNAPVEQPADNAEGVTTVQGLVTLRINLEDTTLLDEEIAQVKGIS